MSTIKLISEVSIRNVLRNFHISVTAFYIVLSKVLEHGELIHNVSMNIRLSTCHQVLGNFTDSLYIFLFIFNGNSAYI